MRNPLRVCLFILLTPFAGCDQHAPTEPEIAPPIASDSNAQWERDNQNLSHLAQQLLNTTLTASQTLQQRIEKLLETPNLERLTAAQNAWQATAKDLEAFYVFSRMGIYSGSPHSDLIQLQYNIAAWPIHPGYLDAYGEHAFSGLVFDIGTPISAEFIREQHGLTNNGDASLGIYAMEFILFGESNNRGPLLFQAITELNEQHAATGYNHLHELPRNRRRQLLELQADLLVSDLQTLIEYWQNQRPPISDARFKLAGLTMITENILAVAELQKAQGEEKVEDHILWRGRQLAQRIERQLLGWQQGLQHLKWVEPPLDEKLLPGQATTTLLTEQLINNLHSIAEQPTTEIPATIAARRKQWRPIYRQLRALADSLELKPDGPAAQITHE